ncbi:MAG: hypothetical protein Q7T01_02175 [bacterium]|nr:hypothetical protein [bacterium]
MVWEDVVEVLDNGRTVLVGVDATQYRAHHKLFYSTRDDAFFVAIQDVTTGHVITVLPLEFVRWNIGADMRGRARLLAFPFRRPTSAWILNCHRRRGKSLKGGRFELTARLQSSADGKEFTRSARFIMKGHVQHPAGRFLEWVHVFTREIAEQYVRRAVIVGFTARIRDRNDLQWIETLDVDDELVEWSTI